MTENKLNNHDYIFCKTCNKFVKNIHNSSLKQDKNTIQRCNVCDWIKRHGGIPSVDGYSEYEVLTTVQFFIYEESLYINDLADKIKRSIEDTIKLYLLLNIKGKRVLVKSLCSYCNMEIENYPSVYLKHSQLYCNSECYYKYKKDNTLRGENSKYYSRIDTTCTNCGKPIKIIPHDYNMTNSFGDSHHFCKKECYWEFRSKYYIGDKCPITSYEFSEEQKEKRRINMINNSKKANRLNSKIQLKINDMLNKNNIKYEREYTVGYYSADNYLVDFNLIIEVMGDYWHASPIKYNKNKYLINEMQQKGIVKDKQKKSYIKSHLDVNILYLWEHDINVNIDVCEALILKYIENKGILENYNSFNWSIKDGDLILNNDIIIPYQDIPSSEYQEIIKKKVG